MRGHRERAGTRQATDRGAASRLALLLAVTAVVGVVFLAAFPARAWLAQRQEQRDLAAHVHGLAERNRALEERVRQLGADAEIERLAREQFNLVRPGQEAYVIVPPPAPSPPAGPPPTHHRPGWWSRAWHRITSVFA